MSWETTEPLDSDLISAGPADIRTLKTDLQTSLRAGAATGTEAVFPGSDTANPVFRYRGLSGATGARPTAGQYGLFFDTTRKVLQRDNGVSWDDISGGLGLESGVVMVFYQAAAPTGWTKSTAHNDKALRVVSGTGGGSGGTHALTSPPSTAHTHSVASSNIDHYHESPVVYGTISTALYTSQAFGSSGDASAVTPLGTSAAAVGVQANTSFAKTNTMSANASHDHGAATGSNGPTAFAPAFIDVIVCVKD
jgi:hypothetical protein